MMLGLASMTLAVAQCRVGLPIQWAQSETAKRLALLGGHVRKDQRGLTVASSLDWKHIRWHAGSGFGAMLQRR